MIYIGKCSNTIRVSYLLDVILSSVSSFNNTEMRESIFLLRFISLLHSLASMMNTMSLDWGTALFCNCRKSPSTSSVPFTNWHLKTTNQSCFRNRFCLAHRNVTATFCDNEHVQCDCNIWWQWTCTMWLQHLVTMSMYNVTATFGDNDHVQCGCNILWQWTCTMWLQHLVTMNIYNVTATFGDNEHVPCDCNIWWQWSSTMWLQHLVTINMYKVLSSNVSMGCACYMCSTLPQLI
jgi:hypothetical protein